MSITADVRAIYFGLDTDREANTRYPIVSGGTGSAWLRGAYISTSATVYNNIAKLFYLHDGERGDTLMTFGVGNWQPQGFVLMGEECYINFPSGIYISSNLEEFIQEPMMTFFVS